MEDLNFRKGDAKTDVFGSDRMLQPSPVEKIPDGPTTPEVAYQMVKDETFAQTQPRLNLATFVTTYMDEYATKLMNEAININYIDETEYPRIAVMNGKCINIVANLWNSPEKDTWKTGALAIGSSEACMLGGVAAWLRWRKKRQAQGKPFDKPNFVISTGFQVVWEKFAQLWQIEMREVPLTLDKTTLDPEEALKMCDENTICVVPIQGVTWTGLNDDVEALDKALDAYNAKTGYDIPIHVDAASGGFILPFLYPEKKWDFRLKWVLSIMIVSGVTPFWHFTLIALLIGVTVLVSRKYLQEDVAVESPEEEKEAEKKEAPALLSFIRKPEMLLIQLGIVGLFALVVESAMFDWSGLYFESVLQVPKSLQIGFLVFMVMMTVGRFLTNSAYSVLGKQKVLQLAGFFIFAGFFISAMLGGMFESMTVKVIVNSLGFMLVGLGISCMVPTIYSLVGAKSKTPVGIALTILSSISFIGSLIAPLLIGAISQAFNMKYAYIVVGLLGLCILLMTTFCKAFKNN